MKTLLIVDIQSKFRNSFDENYLDETINYLKKNAKKYDKIVSIMEKNVSEGDYIPSEIHQKLNYYPIFKCYDASYTKKKLESSTNFTINKGEISANIEIPMGSFLLREQEGYIIGNRSENSIEMDYMNKGLYNLLNSLRYDEITIIGGGLYNCVRKTQKFLEFLDINSTIDSENCYTIEEEEDVCPLNRFDFYVEKRN